MKRTLFVIIAIVLILAGLAIYISPKILLQKRLKTYHLNKAVMRLAFDKIFDYQTKHGKFPTALKEIDISKDAWGFPLHYFSDGKVFVLVSFQRDGKPGGGLDTAPTKLDKLIELEYLNDPYSYINLINSKALWERPTRTCLDETQVDLVMTHHGWIQGCGI